MPRGNDLRQNGNHGEGYAVSFGGVRTPQQHCRHGWRKGNQMKSDKRLKLQRYVKATVRTKKESHLRSYLTQSNTKGSSGC